MFFWAQCGACTECRPRAQQGLGARSARGGRWLVLAAADEAAVTLKSAGPAAQYPLTPDPSPSFLPLFFFILSLSLSLVSPFPSVFLLFLLLSFVGLSCKCSCRPPILVVLCSLLKSNKLSSSSTPSLLVCVHHGEPVVGLLFHFFPPNSRVFICGISHEWIMQITMKTRHALECSEHVHAYACALVFCIRVFFFYLLLPSFEWLVRLPMRNTQQFGDEDGASLIITGLWSRRSSLRGGPLLLLPFTMIG